MRKDFCLVIAKTTKSPPIELESFAYLAPDNTPAEIVAYKIDKFNNNLTPPPSPSVKRSSHLWRDMMGVLRRKDSTAASSNVALANALNNNRISCPTGGNGNRSPSISILRHHRYYYSEVGVQFYYFIGRDDRDGFFWNFDLFVVGVRFWVASNWGLLANNPSFRRLNEA